MYVCHCGSNISAALDVGAVRRAAADLEGVVAARENRFLCGPEGQQLMRQDVERLGLDRVVVAACSPWLHEATFSQACADAGLNSFCMQIANIREQVAWVTPDGAAATDKAVAAVAAAVRRVKHHRPLHPARIAVTRRVLVIGAGIAGVEAALRLGEAGIEVVLVEREPSIGGHMAMLDRVFPTLECAACVLVPRLTAVLQHPRITVLTSSDVVAAEGGAGRFRVRVRQRPRYVDQGRCTGCGTCIEGCPSRETPSAFDQGLSAQPAIHFTHGQALPHHPLIDRATCYHFDGGACDACRRACSAGAIDFAQAAREVEVEAGGVIVATGFQPFEPAAATQYGYGRWDNVVTSLQFERLCHPAGPTGGRLVLKDGRTPESIAILHCVGSRDTRFNRHCSRVCCSAALKAALMAREKTRARVFEFYVDLRAGGRQGEEFYERAQRSGTVFVHGKGTEVIGSGGRLLVKAEDAMLGRLVVVPVDMVVLMVGMEARGGAAGLGHLLGLGCSGDGFFMERHPKLAAGESLVPGVFLAGACQGPKDITESVAHGAAAAMSALALVSREFLEAPATQAVVGADRCSGCALCLGDCGRGALSLVPHDGRAVASVDPALCDGCGSCAATCPTGALDQIGFSRAQLGAEIEGLLA